ncbi:antigen identified by monoclonal antibody Ki-67 [Saitoella coloradoensis]
MAQVLGTLLIPAHDDSNRISPFPVLKEEIKIGRNISCDVRIHDRDVSRTHCVIAFGDASAPSTPAKSNTAVSGRRAWIRNTGTHGTALNGAALTKKTALEDGDVIEILGNQFQWVYGAYPSTSNIDSPPIIDTPARPATASRGLFSGMGSLLRSAVKGRTPGRNVSPVKQTRFESPIKARSPITTTPHRAGASPASGQEDVYVGSQSPLARKEEVVAPLIASPKPVKTKEIGELKTDEVGMYAEEARMLRDISNSPSPEGLAKVNPAPLFTKPASPSPHPPAPIAAPGTPLRANPPIAIPASIARARFAPPSPSPALLSLFSPAKPKRRVMEDMKEESPVRLPAMVPSVLRQGSPVVRKVEEEEEEQKPEEVEDVIEEVQEEVFDVPVTEVGEELEVSISATPKAAPQPAINTPVAGPFSKRAISLSKKAFTPAPEKSRKWLDRDLPRAAPMSAPRPSPARTANGFSAAAVLNNPSYSTATGIERVEPHMHSHAVGAEGQRKVRVGVQEGKTPEEFLVGLSESERVLLGLNSTEAADGDEEAEEEQEQEKIDVFEDGESMRVGEEEEEEEELVEEGLEELPAEPVEKRRLSGEQPGRILPAHLLPGSELTPVKTHSPGKWRATGPAKKMRLGAQSRPVGKLMRGTKRKFPAKYVDEDEDAEGGERLGKRRRVMTVEEEEDEYDVVWRGVDGEEIVFYDDEFASETEEGEAEAEAEFEVQADENEVVEVQADVDATAVGVLEEAVDESAVEQAAPEQQQEEKDVDQVLEEQIEDGEQVDAAQVKVDELEIPQPEEASVESAAQEVQLDNALPDGFATVADLPEFNIGDLDTFMDDVPVAFAKAAAAAEAEVLEATAAIADADAVAADLMQEFVNEVATDALEKLAEEVAKETSEQEAAIVDMSVEVERDETTEEQEIAELAKEVEGDAAPVPQTIEVPEVAAAEGQEAEQPVLEKQGTVEEFEDAVELPMESEAEPVAEAEEVFEDASDVVVPESTLEDGAGAEAALEEAILSAQPAEAEVVEQADVSMVDASVADISAVLHDAVADVAAELAVVAEDVIEEQASEETVEVAAPETIEDEIATNEQVVEAALEEPTAEDAPVLDDAQDAEVETDVEVAETQVTADSLPEIVVEKVATEISVSDDAEIADAVPVSVEVDVEIAADAEVSAKANVDEPIVQAEEGEAEAETTEQPEEVTSEEPKAPLSPLKPIKTKRTRRTRAAEPEPEQEAPVEKKPAAEEPCAEDQEEPAAPLSPLEPIKTKRTHRGRTAEPEPESVVLSSPAPNFIVEISTPPPKTTRGTRSKAEEVVSSEPATESVNESKPAARRGRKAAAPTKDVESELTPDAELAEEEARPATRRSRRAATEEPTAEAPAAQPAAAKPTRGRKARSRTITEPSEEPVQEEEPIAAEEVPLNKATKTTRRSRAEKDEVDEVNASETSEAVEEKPVVRRGRGAKAQAQEDQPAVVEEPEENPTKSTRRARTNIIYMEAPAATEEAEEKLVEATRVSRRGKADDAVEVAVAVEVPASPPKPARRGRHAKENVPIATEEPASEAAAPAKKTRGTRSRAATVEPEAVEKVVPAKGRGKRAASAAPSEAPAPKSRRTRGASAAPSELDSTEAPASSLADVDTNAKPARRGRAAQAVATEEPIPEEESVEEEPKKATRASKRKAEVMEKDEPAPARRTTRRKV